MAKKSDYGSTKWIYKLLPKIIFIVFIAVSQRATFPNVPKDSQVLLLCYTTYELVPKGNRGATEIPLPTLGNTSGGNLQVP